MRHFANVRKRCFTLVEMLVAVAVLAMLWVLISQAIGMTFQATQLSLRNVSDAQQARFVLDRMGGDFAMMPKREDLDYGWGSSFSGSDTMRFITRIKGYKGDRPLSIVSYRVRQESGSSPMLYRGVKGIHWEDRGFMGMGANGKPQSLLTLPSELNLADADYDLLSEAVFRMEVFFLRKSDSRLVVEAPAITNLTAVVVAVATLGSESRRMMTPEQVILLAERLGDCKEGETPMQSWSRAMDRDFRAFAEGVPLKAAQSVHVYERFYSMAP